MPPRPDRSPDQSRWMPYGPARLSAAKLAGKHAELNLDMKPYLPTYQPNLQGALAYDSVWWAQQQELKDRFAAWLEARDLPGLGDDFAIGIYPSCAVAISHHCVQFCHNYGRHRGWGWCENSLLWISAAL